MADGWFVGLLTLIGGGAIIGIGSGVLEVSAKAVLVAVGSLVELVGLFLGVYPDLSHDWVYRLLGLPRDHRITPPAGALFISVADPIGVYASGALDATDPQKIEGLMQRTAELALDINRLKADIEVVQHVWAARLTDARHDIELTFQQALTAKLAEYRPHRIAGFIVLFIGFALSTVANLL